jgi:hypothetical protein
MGTVAEFALLLGVGVAAICGAATGRPFAIEGENRRASILAAAYCGAGAGLLSSTLITFVVVLIAAALHPEKGAGAAVLNAGEAVGPALLWGIVSGAGGGLLVGLLVALFKRYTPRQDLSR